MEIYGFAFDLRFYDLPFRYFPPAAPFARQKNEKKKQIVNRKSKAVSWLSFDWHFDWAVGYFAIE